MLQRATAPACARADPQPIEFYTVELMPLKNGLLSVSIKATACESLGYDDFELVDTEVTHQHVPSLESALAVIRGAISHAH
jgi:hypothetical protein